MKPMKEPLQSFRIKLTSWIKKTRDLLSRLIS